MKQLTARTMRALAWPPARRAGPAHSISSTAMVPPTTPTHEDQEEGGGGCCTSEDELASSGSEPDEAEQRRELLNDKWRQLFDKYDPEGFGEIPWDDFLVVLRSPEFEAQIEPNKREILTEKAAERKTSAITFQDFVNVLGRCCVVILGPFITPAAVVVVCVWNRRAQAYATRMPEFSPLLRIPGPPLYLIWYTTL
ncbi:hypothetical protein B566_EDAN001084 [Ephemera danica]|nr:hypothetical protein B566_EDAN001084 [Ephemera danica]